MMYTLSDTREIFYGDHPDFDQEPVETVTITLPTGPGPLADFLDANGHGEAAQALRGFVMSWEPIEVDDA